MEVCNDHFRMAWLAFVTLQATFCGSLVLQPQRVMPMRANQKPAGYFRPAVAPPANLNPLQARPPSQRTSTPVAPPAAVAPAMLPLRQSNALLRPRARGGVRVSAVLPLSGAVDSDASGGDGRRLGERPAGDGTTEDEPAGETAAAAAAAAAAVVQAEAQRLMSMPTIDIKLELQMRGVEHRDAFEKVDLARRLAEARVSCPSPPPGATETGKANDVSESDEPGTKETAQGREATESASATATAAEEAPSEDVENRGGDAAPVGDSAVYARDVARATRMGKASVLRELNAMGIAHSRLSDVSVLARLYANGRREAREETEEARRFPRAARGTGGGGSRYADDNSTEEGEEGREKERGGKGKGEEEEGRWSETRGQWGRVVSGLPWNGGAKRKDDEEEEGRGRGGSASWGEEKAGVTLGREDGSRDGSETDWSTRANAESVAYSPSSGAGGGGSVDNGRGRRASLHARADRMSSRELMKALDDLGARYRIPAPRLELQEAFVSAVLAEDERGQGGAWAGTGGHERGGNAEIVPLSPYAATESEEEEADQRKRAVGFGTYHSALRWARQLSFDEVLDELRYRGVKCNPRGDYSHLTRVLADEVLADEELMEAEGVEGAYDAKVELAMSMSAQEMISDLRAGGEKVDVTLSKEALAERLAEMNLRLRGGPLPHSGSGNAFSRRRQPGGRGAQGFASPRGLGAGAGVPADGFLGHDGSGEGEDVLLELEEAAKSVGGAALLVAKETAAFMSETAAGLFPEVFPEERRRGEGDSSSLEEQQQRRRRIRQESGGGGGGGGGARDAEQRRRAGAVRERASGVRRAASGFAQSSVNRAGFAVAQSMANGALKAAEAAADWAGDGALAREYVLLFIAAFCLVFKRGVGAAVALLVVIRFGRTAAQRLVSEGWREERAKRERARDGRRVSTGAAAVGGGGGGGATTYRRDNQSARYTSAGRRPRRREAATASAKVEENSNKKRPRPKKAQGKVKRKLTPARRSEKATARKPLWESDSDDDDRGCVVM